MAAPEPRQPQADIGARVAAQHTGTIKGTHAALDVKSRFAHSAPGSEHDPKPCPRCNRAEVKVIPQPVTKAPHP